MKLKNYILYWYKTYRQPGQARTTQITTMSCIRNHLLTAPLSEKELAEIHLRDLQTFLTEEYLHGKNTRLKHVDLTGEPLSAYTMTIQYPNATYFTCLCSVPKPSVAKAERLSTK